MDHYFVFVIIAALTVLSPGPGVLLTLTNSIRYGVSGAAWGIYGLVIATFIVAGISATSVGIILATSSVAFSIMKYVGAAYLIYLGVKLWRSPSPKIEMGSSTVNDRKRQFVEGMMIQLTNPKSVFFFMSIFPQFISHSSAYTGQFFLLVATYSGLLLMIHFLYAFLAKTARIWLTSANGGRVVNRLGGATFMGFGVGLASASR